MKGELKTVSAINKTFQYKGICIQETQGGKIMIEMEEPENKTTIIMDKKTAKGLADELLRLINN